MTVLPPPPQTTRRLPRWLAVLAVLALVVVVAGVVLVRRYDVVFAASENMRPTIEPGDRVLVDTWADVRRGSVVLYRDGGDDGFLGRAGERTYLKRVVALPDDVIQGRMGRVFVNDEDVTGDYETISDAESFGPVTVPTRHYFVLGDNRPRSFDSRSEGPIRADLVVGVVTRIITPRDRAGRVR